MKRLKVAWAVFIALCVPVLVIAAVANLWAGRYDKAAAYMAFATFSVACDVANLQRKQVNR